MSKTDCPSGKQSYSKALAMALALLCALGCEDSAPIRPGNIGPDAPLTPRENREAEEAALWLSGELIAPNALYEAIKDDLAAIREAYIDSVPQLSIEFKPWWPSSKIGMNVTEEVRQMILRGEPTSIDSLNRVFRATRMDTFRLNVGVWTIVYFEGRLHPERLAEIYEQLDGVTSAGSDSWLGDWSNVYPWRVENGISYLFREGSGTIS